MADLLTHCSELPQRTIEAGATIIEQGAAGGAVLVLVEGTVAVERDGTRLAVIDTPVDVST